MKKNSFYISFVLIIFIIFLFVFSKPNFCAYPKLVSKLVNSFEQIKTWLIKIATPAAAVAVR